jgi:phosphorylcholine metabolism protein LicD
MVDIVVVVNVRKDTQELLLDMGKKPVDYTIEDHTIDVEYFEKMLSSMEVDTNNLDKRYFDYWDA